jgi:hypothetical protein
MKRSPLLDACARIEGHAVQHSLLREYCRGFLDWQNLLERAEKEGMAPLLRKHLDESGSEYPVSVRRSLSILVKRHQQYAQVRLEVLREVLGLFHRNDLTPMVIKGAALCCTLYPDPGLRPMRDMDLLFRPSEVDHAQELLRNAGFVQSTAPIPPDHFHLPSLHRTVGETKICIELHRGLYPNCPPYYPAVDFERLLATATKFKVVDMEAVTFGDEEMLHYLYQHAFRTPLTYESYKLINVADVIGFTEKNFDALNWQRIKEKYQLLNSALPLMHHISPWNLEIVPKSFVACRIRKKKIIANPFSGWPHQRLKVFKSRDTSWYHMLKETFVPPVWWTMVYYGVNTWRGWFWCILQKHPRHIYWWVRLHSALHKNQLDVEV